MKLTITYKELESVAYHFLRKKIKIKSGIKFNSIECEFDTEKWFLGTISFSIYIKHVLPKEIGLGYELGSIIGPMLKLSNWFGMLQLDSSLIRLDISNKEITVYPFKLDKMKKFESILEIKNIDFKGGEVNFELSEIESILSQSSKQ